MKHYNGNTLATQLTLELRGIMRKIFIWGIVIIVVFLLLVVFVSLDDSNNNHIEKERERTIKNLITQMMEVQYKTHDDDVLKEIFTEELRDNIEFYYPRFYKEKPFFFISNKYMNTLRYVPGTNKWYVLLRIYDGFNPINSFYLEIGFTETEPESYLISHIGIGI